MKIENLPRAPLQPNGSAGPRALNPLVFNSFDDTPANPRPGLGYQQLFDRTRPVTLTAKLPDVTRVGDTVELFWDDDDDDDDVPVQTYKLDQATIDKGWLSFSVSVDVIKAPLGKVHYTLFDHEAQDLQTSDTRTVKVNRNVPGGLDPDTDTAINEGLTAASVSPSVIENAATPPITVTVPAWLHMETGDELVVLWNGIRVSAPVLTQAGVGVPQVVSIPEDVVKQGGSSEKLPVNYEIRDIVDNYSLLSPSTFANVNIDPDALPAPRLADANTATNQIDLALLGSKDARVQVATGLLNTGDVVTVTWTGRTPNSEYSEALPAQTVSDPGFEILEFAIANAKVVAVAGGSLSASYQVELADHTFKYSKSANATISGQVVQLVAPELVGAAGGIIDLAIVTGDPVVVTAPAYAGQIAGDRISLIWSGLDAGGIPVNYTDEYTVLAGDEAKDVLFKVDRLNLEPLGGGTLQLSYQVFKASGSSQTSPVTEYSVTAVVLAFPAPVIVEATGGLLKPMEVEAGATFRATYPGMQTSDTIVPVWNDISSIIPWRLGEADGTVESTVPANMIGAVIGKTIDVRYQVQRNGQGYWSDVLKLMVEAIPSVSLPVPAVPEADQATKVLDLNEFEGDAHVTVDPWPFIALGQTIWLTLTGPSGVPTITLLEAHVIQPGEVAGGLNVAIKRADLEAFENGAKMQIMCKVGFPADSGEPEAIAFPVQTYTVSDITFVSGVETWQGYPQTFFEFDLPITFPSGITITARAIQPYANAPYITTNPDGLEQFTSGSSVALKIEFGGLIKHLLFTYILSHNNENTLSIFGQDGSNLGTQYVTNSVSALTFDAPRPIAYAELKIQDPAGDRGIAIHMIEWS